MNPDAEGTVYPAVEFVVDPERVSAFRDLFRIDHGVPPTVRDQSSKLPSTGVF